MFCMVVFAVAAAAALPLQEETTVTLPKSEGYKRYSYHESTYVGEKDGVVYKKQRIEEKKESHK